MVLYVKRKKDRRTIACAPAGYLCVIRSVADQMCFFLRIRMRHPPAAVSRTMAATLP